MKSSLWENTMSDETRNIEEAIQWQRNATEEKAFACLCAEKGCEM